MSGIDLDNFWDTYLSKTLPNYTLLQKKSNTELDDNKRKQMYKHMADIYGNYARTAEGEELRTKYCTIQKTYDRKAFGADPPTQISDVNVYKTKDELEIVQFDKNLMDQDLIMHSRISKSNLEFEVRTNDNIVAFGEGNPFEKAEKDEQDLIYERVNKFFNRLSLETSLSIYVFFEYNGTFFKPIIFENKDDYSTEDDLKKLFDELVLLEGAIRDNDKLDLSSVLWNVLNPVITKLCAKLIQCVLYKMKEKMPDMFSKNELYLMRVDPIKRLAVAGAGRSMATTYPHNDQCLNLVKSANYTNCDIVSIIYYDVKNNNTLEQDKYTSAGFLFSEDMPVPLTPEREKDIKATSSSITDFIKYINVKPRLVTNVPVKSGSYAIWRNSGKYFEPTTAERQITDYSGNQLFAKSTEDTSFSYIIPKIDFKDLINIKNNIFTWNFSPLSILPKTKSGEYYLDNYSTSNVQADIATGLRALEERSDPELFGYTVERNAKNYEYKKKEETEYKPLTQEIIVTLEDDINYDFKCILPAEMNLINDPWQDPPPTEKNPIIVEKEYSGFQLKELGNQYVSAFIDRNFITVRRTAINPFRTLRDVFHQKKNVAIECYQLITKLFQNTDPFFINIKKIHNIIYGTMDKFFARNTVLSTVTDPEKLNNKARLILFHEADRLYKLFLQNRADDSVYCTFLKSVLQLNNKINEIFTSPSTMNEFAINRLVTDEVTDFIPDDKIADTKRYEYYQKYLKYKQKYIQLQKKLIVRKK
jgi:hypothetical protein